MQTCNITYKNKNAQNKRYSIHWPDDHSCKCWNSQAVFSSSLNDKVLYHNCERILDCSCRCIVAFWNEREDWLRTPVETGYLIPPPLLPSPHPLMAFSWSWGCCWLHKEPRVYETLCTISYHLYNLKNVENTHGGV